MNRLLSRGLNRVSLRAGLGTIAVCLLAGCVGNPALRNPPPLSPVHVKQDEFQPGEVRLAFSGDVVFARSDYHASASERPYMVPRSNMLIELPSLGTFTLTPSDRLQRVGTAEVNGRPRRALQIPRAIGKGIALLVDDDGRIDGNLAYFEYGQASWGESVALRLQPAGAYRATVQAIDPRLAVEYAVAAVDRSKRFERYDAVFLGAKEGRAQFALRRYDDAPPAKPVSEDRVTASRGAQRVEFGGLSVQIIDLSEQRLKFVVEAPPAATISAVPVPDGS